MSVDQRSASQSRRIRFTSKGGGYSATFMPLTGDLFQYYEGSPTAPTACYPDFSTKNVDCLLSVTSARAVGPVSPATVEYSVAGTKLTFNASGACTTPGFTALFKIVDGKLRIIGNLVAVAGGAPFSLQAKAMMGAAANSDYVVADLPFSCGPYIDGQSTKVTIAPGDQYNFTIGKDKNTSVTLTAKVFNKDWLSPALFDYAWEQFKSGAFAAFGANTQSITVQEGDVDTYSLFRVTVKEKGTSTVVGQDTQTVLDASDPYDIVTDIYRNDTGAGAESATTDESLDEDMPPDAYLFYVPKMVKRGDSSTVAGAVFDQVSLLDAAGVWIANFSSSTSNGRTGFKIKAQDFRDAHGPGEYELIIEGHLP